MKIISHRGYWKHGEEKNLPIAFDRSFSLGYGTETDVRDYDRELLISHDMPAGREMKFREMLDLAEQKASTGQLTLALNIKADGLAGVIAEELSGRRKLDCFVFDMSVPDMRAYFSAGIPVFTRMSEVERQPAWLDRADGVWLDSFVPEWYGIDDVRTILAMGKRVCVVSSELHGRPHEPLWQKLAILSEDPKLILCTDFPEDASAFFNGIGEE